MHVSQISISQLVNYWNCDSLFLDMFIYFLSMVRFITQVRVGKLSFSHVSLPFFIHRILQNHGCTPLAWSVVRS